MFTVAGGLTDCEMGSSSMPNVSHVDPSLAWQWLEKMCLPGLKLDSSKR
jgi:hypothetical protein